VKVTLCSASLKKVAKVIQRLQRERPLPDGHGAAEGDITANMRFSGFAGELASALALNVRWNAEFTNSTKVADVGRCIQVRTSHAKARKLLVRPHDLKKYGNVPFVFVKQLSLSQFDVVGWIFASDVPKVGELGYGGNYHRPAAYYVDEKHLKPISELSFK
jgi:hypothetical protein